MASPAPPKHTWAKKLSKKLKLHVPLRRKKPVTQNVAFISNEPDHNEGPNTETALSDAQLPAISVRTYSDEFPEATFLDESESIDFSIELNDPEDGAVVSSFSSLPCSLCAKLFDANSGIDVPQRHTFEALMTEGKDCPICQRVRHFTTSLALLKDAWTLANPDQLSTWSYLAKPTYINGVLSNIEFKLCKSDEQQVDVAWQYSQPIDDLETTTRLRTLGLPLFHSRTPAIVRNSNVETLSLSFHHIADSLAHLLEDVSNHRTYFSTTENYIESVLNFTKDHLRSCDNKHKSCGRRVSIKVLGDEDGQSTWLPSRLINIHDHDKIKLCDKSMVEGDVRYTTLSHCWGDAQMLKLTHDTKSSLFGGITQEGLPKTFREAIELTRGLGIDYIWIDSLCILQDDVDDWQIESGLMGKVYNKSYLNLAASASVDSHGGLFQPSQVIFKDVFSAKWSKASGETGTLRCNDIENLEEEFRKAPLYSRAWVTQEMYLAPRTLHFLPGFLYWSCETESVGSTESLGFGDLYRLQNSIWDLSSHGCLRAWDMVVENYTQGKLTMSSDKLTALSGLATVFRPAIGGRTNPGPRYLAGLWEDGLVLSLLWYVDDIKQNIFRPDEYRAPSWSWASMDGKIRTSSLRQITSRSQGGTTIIDYITDNDANLVIVATVGPVTTTPVSMNDPNGQVKSATLFLSAYICHLQVAELINGSWVSVSVKRKQKPNGYSIVLDYVVSVSLNLDEIGRPNNRSKPSWFNQVKSYCSSLDCFLVPLAWTNYPLNNEDDFRATPRGLVESYLVVGLILSKIQPVGGAKSSPATFKRIGTFTTPSSPEIKDFIDYLRGDRSREKIVIL